MIMMVLLIWVDWTGWQSTIQDMSVGRARYYSKVGRTTKDCGMNVIKWSLSASNDASDLARHSPTVTQRTSNEYSPSFLSLWNDNLSKKRRYLYYEADDADWILIVVAVIAQTSWWFLRQHSVPVPPFKSTK